MRWPAISLSVAKLGFRDAAVYRFQETIGTTTWKKLVDQRPCIKEDCRGADEQKWRNIANARPSNSEIRGWIQSRSIAADKKPAFCSSVKEIVAATMGNCRPRSFFRDRILRWSFFFFSSSSFLRSGVSLRLSYHFAEFIPLPGKAGVLMRILSFRFYSVARFGRIDDLYYCIYVSVLLYCICYTRSYRK